MKRKNSIYKTLQKSKPVNHSVKQNKKTIKKSHNYEWKDKIYSVNNNSMSQINNGSIQMISKKNGRLITKSFGLKNDR